MRKTSLFFMIFLCLAVFFPSVSKAGSAIQLALDGKTLNASEVEQNQGVVMVPIRLISEQLGFKVKWEPKAKKIFIHNQNTKLELTLGSKKAKIQNKEVNLQVPVAQRNGVTVVPLRFVGEALGLKVNWDHANKKVNLMRPIQTKSVHVSAPKDEKGKTDLAQISDLKISSNQISVVTEGSVTPKSFMLKEPSRIILDLPSSAFSNEFRTKFGMKSHLKGEAAVSDHALIKNIRFSHFADNPATVRFVVDLTQEVTFQVTGGESSNIVTIDLNQGSETGTVTGKVVEPEKEPEKGVEEKKQSEKAETSTETKSDANDEEVITGKVVEDENTEATKEEVTEETNTRQNGKKFLVVIDPGHGGKDPGAFSLGKQHEKDFNLSLAQKVEEAFQDDPNIQVELTRRDDVFLELPQRVTIAEESKADLFISLHANSNPKATIKGTETYYTREVSKALAKFMHQYVLEAGKLVDRGVREANFHVTRNTTMPAILIEVGYLSNVEDEAKLYSDKFQQNVAEGIKKGITNFLIVE